jgi:hypothetical protein
LFAAVYDAINAQSPLIDEQGCVDRAACLEVLLRMTARLIAGSAEEERKRLYYEFGGRLLRRIEMMADDPILSAPPPSEDSDAASSRNSSLVLHRELATPQSASALHRAIVSALLGSRPRHAGDRRRPYRAAQGRLHRVPARPAPQSVRRLSQHARQREQCAARTGPRRWHAFRSEASMERGASGLVTFRPYPVWFRSPFNRTMIGTQGRSVLNSAQHRSREASNLKSATSTGVFDANRAFTSVHDATG